MKLFEKDELKILAPFYIEHFISYLLFFAPAFWVLTLQKTLSLTQVGILFSVVSVTAFFFEIPTGAFADIYGRKRSVIVGLLLGGVSLTAMFFAKSFLAFLVLYFLLGVAGTFVSGAQESWIIDLLKHEKKSRLVKEYFLKSYSIIRLSLFFSGFIGAVVVSKLGLNWIWIFAGAAYIISAAVLSRIPEYELARSERKQFKDIFSQARLAFKYSINHHVLLFLLVATFFVMFRDAFSADLVWQPFLGKLGLPLFAFGVVFSISTLLGSMAPFITKGLVKQFRNEKSYLISLFVVMIVLDALVFFVNGYVYGLILLVLMIFVVDLFMPINSTYFQKFVPSRLRATVTSLNGMVIAAAYAISLPISGFTADRIGLKYTIIAGAVFLIPAILLFLKIKDKKPVIPS